MMSLIVFSLWIKKKDTHEGSNISLYKSVGINLIYTKVATSMKPNFVSMSVTRQINPV
jgi:hypothetical protein